jgi:Flp pilus assembly protein TadB
MFILFLFSGFICTAMFILFLFSGFICTKKKQNKHSCTYKATNKKQNKHSCTYKATKEKHLVALYVQLCLFCFLFVVYMYNYVYFVSLSWLVCTAMFILFLVRLFLISRQNYVLHVSFCQVFISMSISTGLLNDN